VRLDSDSNVNDESDEQAEKHCRERTSTEEGIQMDFNALHEKNDDNPIRARLDGDSKVNDESEPHV
jgi:hypothetical protein